MGRIRGYGSLGLGYSATSGMRSDGCGAMAIVGIGDSRRNSSVPSSAPLPGFQWRCSSLPSAPQACINFSFYRQSSGCDRIAATSVSPSRCLISPIWPRYGLLAAKFPHPFVDDSKSSTLVGGGLAYLFITLMTVTSFAAPRRLIGERAWRILHTVGSYYIWLIFLNSYSARACRT